MGVLLYKKVFAWNFTTIDQFRSANGRDLRFSISNRNSTPMLSRSKWKKTKWSRRSNRKKKPRLIRMSLRIQ